MHFWNENVHFVTFTSHFVPTSRARRPKKAKCNLRDCKRGNGAHETNGANGTHGTNEANETHGTNKTNMTYRAYEAYEEEQAQPYLFGCASFPSPDEPDGYGNYYEAKVYVDMPDGTTTETVLTLREPLNSGQLKVVKLELQLDGQVKPVGTGEVGVSVTLDWKDGGTHDIEL